MANDKDLDNSVKDTIAAVAGIAPAKTDARAAMGQTRAAEEFAQAARAEAATALDSVQTLAQSTTEVAVSVQPHQTADAAEAARRTQEASRDAAAKAARGVDALMSVQGVMADGMQSVMREWMSYSQGSLQRWSEQMQTLMKARTVQDVVTVQTDILRTEVEHLMRSGQRISQLTSQTASDATRRITGKAQEAARQTA